MVLILPNSVVPDCHPSPCDLSCRGGLLLTWHFWLSLATGLPSLPLQAHYSLGWVEWPGMVWEGSFWAVPPRGPGQLPVYSRVRLFAELRN